MKTRICLYGMGVVLLAARGPAADFTVSGGAGELGASPRAYQSAEVHKAYPLGWWARTTVSPLRVLFSPGNEFQLLPRSELQVSGSGEAGGRFRRVLNLKKGEVELDLRDLRGGEVQVETPTAVCGAVGTAFRVNSETGEFDVSNGRIFAKARGDSTFEADAVGGSFTLAPGKENGYARADVNGDFRVNGRQVRGGSAHVEVAKARGGTGQAAVRINSGSLGAPGSYLMEGGKLQPVKGEHLAVHGEYLNVAGREGSLQVRKQSLQASGGVVPADLEEQLNATARRATELRKKLFTREAIREAAQENVRSVTRPENSSLRPPIRSH